MAVHLLLLGAQAEDWTPFVGDTYFLLPNGIDKYLQPDGTSLYIRP